MIEILCPKCGELIGYKTTVPMPKIEKIQTTIGDRTYPPMDIEDMSFPMVCLVCSYTFTAPR